jgi:hypothetical protein
MRSLHLAPLLLSFALPAACGSDPSTGATSTASTSATTASASATTGTGGGGQGGAGGAPTSTSTSSATTGAGGAHPDKSAGCASTFGTALTNAFGRIDGTVLAVVKPVDTQCAMPNNDHLVLEVTMMGAVYRMVANLQSTIGDPNVRFQILPHALPPPAWAEGWHTGVTLDYVTDLGVHAGGAFMPYPLAQLADVVTDNIAVGQKISVYATSSGGASAHLIHRNLPSADGAIVIDPEGSPKMLLFSFADQSF